MSLEQDTGLLRHKMSFSEESTQLNGTGTAPTETPMDYVKEPLGLRIVRLTVYVIIFLLATFGNALVIFVVYKTRELHTGK